MAVEIRTFLDFLARGLLFIGPTFPIAQLLDFRGDCNAASIGYPRSHPREVDGAVGGRHTGARSYSPISEPIRPACRPCPFGLATRALRASKRPSLASFAEDYW